MKAHLIPFAGCVQCGALICSSPPCGHSRSPWLRLDTYEQLGVCAACPGAAAAWDAGEISPDQVQRGLEARKELGQVPNVKPEEAIKVAVRLNTRIGWFEMNNRMEKPA